MPLRHFARGSLLSGNTNDEVQPEGIVSVSHEENYVQWVIIIPFFPCGIRKNFRIKEQTPRQDRKLESSH